MQQRYIMVIALCGLLNLCGGCSERNTDNDLSLIRKYDYRDTRTLVALLQDAADLIAQNGTNAFTQFATKKDKWTYRDAYIYVYSTNGICLYHGGMPELTGKALANITDADGRLMLQNALSAANSEANTHGWVHYWWNIPQRLYPIWKSSCHQIVEMPDGQKVLIGSGLANLPRERCFVELAVDHIAHELKTRGIDEALDDLCNGELQHSLPGSPVFIFTESGEALVAPAFHINQALNIIDYQDDVGHAPLRLALEQLETTNRTWVILLTKTPLSMNMQKKGLYVRRVTTGTNVLFAAATADLPKPSWMD